MQAARQLVFIVEQSSGTHPNDAGLMKRLLSALGFLADGLELAQRFDEAVATYRHAVSVRAVVDAAETIETPSDFSFVCTSEFALSLRRGLSTSLREAGLFDEAVEEAERTVQIFEQMDAINPENRRLLAFALTELSDGLFEAGSLNEAFSTAEQALEIFESIVDAEPTNNERRVHLAIQFENLRASLSEVGRSQEAVAISERIVTTIEPVVATPDCKIESRALLGLILLRVRPVLVAAGRGDDASTALYLADSLAMQLPGAGPEERLEQDLCIYLLRGVSDELFDLQRVDEAVASLGRAIEISRLPIVDRPEDVGSDSNRGWQIQGGAARAREYGRLDAAIRCFARAAEIFRMLVETDPMELDHRIGLAGAFLGLAECLRAVGRSGEADAVQDELVAIANSITDLGDE